MMTEIEPPPGMGPRAAPRVVIATLGSLGDVHPFIAIARALRSVGIEPIFATAGKYREKIEAEGLKFHELRPDVPEIARRLGLPLAAIVDRIERDESYLIRRLLVPFFEETYADALTAMRDAQLVITHDFCFSAKFAAEKRGLPLVNVVLAPVSFMSAYDPPRDSDLPVFTVAPKGMAVAWNRLLLRLLKRVFVPVGTLKRIRAGIGLSPHLASAFFTDGPKAELTVGLFPDAFGAPQPDHLGNTQIAGFGFYDGTKGEAQRLDDDLETFLAEGAPPLVFTLGSFVVDSPRDFYLESVKAAKALGRRAILLANDKIAAKLTSELSDDMRVRGYVPHSLLMPRAAVIIHHGGMGTTAQALRAARPQLVVPFIADQPDNGARIAHLGVGRRLPEGRYRADRVIKELRALIDDPAYQRRASEIAGRISQQDGAAALAAWVAQRLDAKA